MGLSLGVLESVRRRTEVLPEGALALRQRR